MTGRKISLRAFILGSAAMSVASAAWAQGAAPTAPQEGLGDIIVTAQKQEESAQRAPIVIDTVTSEELQSMSDVRQLQNAVPGMQFANAGNVIQTYVRGIGSFNAKSTQESAVAYSYDGVYLFTTTQVSPAMFDLARIEALKGPQGTLYGRNASGGAVNLIPESAKLNTGFAGFLSGDLGNYSLRRLVGALNVPVSDTFAVRVAAQHVDHDGYLSDGSSDDNTTAGRIRTLWQPSSDVSIKLNFDAARVRGNGPGAVVFPFKDPNNPWRGTQDPVNDSGTTRVSGTAPFTAPYNRLNQWGTNAQLDWKLGFATLTLLPAYRHETIHQHSYVAGYGTTENGRLKQTSFEARLANQTDRLRWVAGAYYLNVDINQDFLIDNPNPPVGRAAVNYYDNPNNLKSWAAFGEATYNLTDELRLIGGLRYTWEKVVSTGFQNQTAAAAPTVATPAYRPGVEPGDFVIAENVKNDAVTWRAGVQYDVAPGSMLFATASRGFKGGGSYVDSHPVNPTFKPEYVTAFELGSRNRFFDNTLQLNLEGFYWKIKDQQIAFVGFNVLNQPKFQTTNAGRSRTYGGSASIAWLATPNDRFDFGVEYVKSKYLNFTRIQPTAPAGTLCPTTVVTAGPPAKVAINCTGFPMMRTPKWAGSAAYEHRFDLGSAGSLTLNGDVTFASSRWFSIDFSPATYDKGYAVFNAQLTYQTAAENVSISLWGKNLSKAAYVTGGNQSGTFSRPTINEPRTYGVRVQTKF